MRKLKQIIKLSDAVDGYMETPGHDAEIMALDENGEIWFGELETTEDNRRVIDWTPVNTPKDGAGFTEPQLSFFDKWEQDARERIKVDTETSGETVPLATEEQDDTNGTGKTPHGSSDNDLEDGEGIDPYLG